MSKRQLRRSFVIPLFYRMGGERLRGESYPRAQSKRLSIGLVIGKSEQVCDGPEQVRPLHLRAVMVPRDSKSCLYDFLPKSHCFEHVAMGIGRRRTCRAVRDCNLVLQQQHCRFRIDSRKRYVYDVSDIRIDAAIDMRPSSVTRTWPRPAGSLVALFNTTAKIGRSGS